MKRGIRDFLICVSLANLILLGAWRLLLDRTSYAAAVHPNHFLAIISASMILAALFWCGMWLARRCGHIGLFLAQWIFLQSIVITLASFCVALIPADRRTLAPIIALPILLMAVPRFPRWVATLFLALVPCIGFLALRSAWQMWHTPQPNVVQGNFGRLSAEGPRVLLVIFDEMSEYVAFAHRPHGVKMPAFDRLRRQAVVATAAYPPASYTVLSMPALLTGRAIRDVQPLSGNELQVQYLPDHDFEPLTASSTVFSDVHALGLGTAMIGWYHPYCSTVSDLDFCAHVKAGMARPGIYHRGGIPVKILDVVSQTAPLVSETNWAKQRRDQAFHETHDLEDSLLMATTRESVASFRSGLMVIHLAVPHPPAVQAAGMYLPNLAAADQELADIRRIMEDAGTWDDTAVLVTSDHWWRTHAWLKRTPLPLWTLSEEAYMDADTDPRVPFIAKLPGEHIPARYTREFNILLGRKLVHALLTREITTPKALKAWLDLHRKDVPPAAYKDAIEPF